MMAPPPAPLLTRSESRRGLLSSLLKRAVLRATRGGRSRRDEEADDATGGTEDADEGAPAVGIDADAAFGAECAGDTGDDRASTASSLGSLLSRLSRRGGSSNAARSSAARPSPSSADGGPKRKSKGHRRTNSRRSARHGASSPTVTTNSLDTGSVATASAPGVGGASDSRAGSFTSLTGSITGSLATFSATGSATVAPHAASAATSAAATAITSRPPSAAGRGSTLVLAGSVEAIWAKLGDRTLAELVCILAARAEDVALGYRWSLAEEHGEGGFGAEFDDGSSAVVAPWLSAFGSTQPAPKIALDRYLARLVRGIDAYVDGESHSSSSLESAGAVTLVAASVLVDRLGLRWGRVLTERSRHRVFLAAVVAAHKQLDDEPFSNAYAALIGGVPLAEMNRMEHALVGALDFRLAVNDDEWRAMHTSLLFSRTGS